MQKNVFYPIALILLASIEVQGDVSLACEYDCRTISCGPRSTCGLLASGFCGCIRTESGAGLCDRYCASVRCPANSRCMERSGSCGCFTIQRPIGSDGCSSYCAVALCSVGTTCGLMSNGQCGCYKDDQCRSFCARTRCTSNAVCGLKLGKCGCHVTTTIDCRGYCAQARCGPGTTCGEVNGRCGCYEEQECEVYCATTTCGSSYDCGLQNGKCGCYRRSGGEIAGDGCRDYCNRARCSAGLVCGMMGEGGCGCRRPREIGGGGDLECSSFCAQGVCGPGTKCGLLGSGRCGCLVTKDPVQPPPSNPCVPNPCGPCQRCVPQQLRRCFRPPCPQYTCIRRRGGRCGRRNGRPWWSTFRRERETTLQSEDTQGAKA